MCQSKASGGKRCFAHHPGTKASIAYVHLKTGIDKEQIYAIMKELRKEGKNLEAPTPEELEKYFSLEEFKTKYDASLSDQEKVAILKQLLSARAEAEREGVSGGIFHSWKNSLKRAVEKFKKPFIAASITGALLFTTSCSAGVNPNPTPEETKSPIAAECVVENPEEMGDAVTKELVTDEFGEYCSITVSPDLKDKYLKIEDQPGLAEAGYTQADLDAAQDSAYKFFVEQSLDSTLLDTGGQEEFNAWVKNDSGISSEWQQAYIDNYASAGNSGGSIVTNVFSAPLPRDGAPRGTAISIDPINAVVTTHEGQNYLSIRATVGATYRAQDTDIIATIQKHNPDLTADQIKEKYPDLADENPLSYYTIVSTSGIVYKPENGKVGDSYGTSSSYSLFAGQGEAFLIND